MKANAINLLVFVLAAAFFFVRKADARGYASDDDDGGDRSVQVDDDDEGEGEELGEIHGIIMSIVFAFMYPAGAALMPLLKRWWIHAGWQILALLLMWAGFALGYLAEEEHEIWHEEHVIYGTVISALFTIQMAGGYLHHSYYVKHQRRGVLGLGHVWFGRALMVAGIINGGLGLQLSNAGDGFIAAYSVVSAVTFLLYIGIAAWKGARTNSPSKGEESPAKREVVEKS